jgi:hypothetical protein
MTELEKLDKLANQLNRALMKTLDYDLLLWENQNRSFYDRINRGMSPWCAQTSRYEPEEGGEE